MSFKIECEKQNKFSFLDVQIIHQDKTFTISIYRKPTLVEFINILIAFYHQTINLVQITDSLIDAYEFSQVEIKCTISLSKIYFRKKMATLKIL